MSLVMKSAKALGSGRLLQVLWCSSMGLLARDLPLGQQQPWRRGDGWLLTLRLGRYLGELSSEGVIRRSTVVVERV